MLFYTLVYLEINLLIINFYESFRSFIAFNSYIDSKNEIIKRYINFNKKNLLNSSSNKKYVLIDCFYESSWIASNSIIASELSKKHDIQIASYNSQPYTFKRNWYLNSIFKSFGCVKHFSVKLNFKQKLQRIKIFKEVLNNIRNNDDLINLKISDVLIGIDIYESILRDGAGKGTNVPTVNISSMLTHKHIFNALTFFIFFDDLFKENKISALLLSHDTYVPTGVPMKLAFKYKKPVYFANHREIIQADRPHQIYERFKSYKNYFEKLDNSKKKSAIMLASVNLNKRLRGGLKIDMSYQEKSAFENNIVERQTSTNNKLKVLITAHCFFDNPHCYGGMIFNDFYDWLEFLGNLSLKLDYEWYIKPHRDFLKGNLEVLKIFENKFKNFKVINPDTSFHQLKKEGIKNVVTCYGSVGHELPILGFKVINVGYNPHISFNFNTHCLTKNECFNTLLNLDNDNEVIDVNEIYKFYYIHNMLLKTDMFNYNYNDKKVILEVAFTLTNEVNSARIQFFDKFTSDINFLEEYKKNFDKFNNSKSVYSFEYQFEKNNIDIINKKNNYIK